MKSSLESKEVCHEKLFSYFTYKDKFLISLLGYERINLFYVYVQLPRKSNHNFV